jgi:hypothetical protein
VPFGMYTLFPLDWADLMGLGEGEKGGTLRSVITLSTIRNAITWSVSLQVQIGWSELDREKATLFQYTHSPNQLTNCLQFTS